MCYLAWDGDTTKSRYPYQLKHFANISRLKKNENVWGTHQWGIGDLYMTHDQVHCWLLFESRWFSQGEGYRSLIPFFPKFGDNKIQHTWIIYHAMLLVCEIKMIFNQEARGRGQLGPYLSVMMCKFSEFFIWIHKCWLDTMLQDVCCSCRPSYALDNTQWSTTHMQKSLSLPPHEKL